MTRNVSPSELLVESLRLALLARARSMRVKRGQIILAEGTLSTDVYLVRSGRVQVSLFSAQGRETIIRNLGVDSLFGELGAIDLMPRSATVVAIEDCNLAYLTGPEFVEFLEQVPSAGLWMARIFSAQVRSLTDKIVELSTMSVSSRLHRELLRMCHEIGVDDDRVELQRLPTHADLAARIGTHREAITREFGALKDEGVVNQRGRTLVINSVKRLEALADRYAI
jgi:CRP/FNR family transcriptional regulator, cyclic AMP receptor protein